MPAMANTMPVPISAAALTQENEIGKQDPAAEAEVAAEAELSLRITVRRAGQPFYYYVK